VVDDERDDPHFPTALRTHQRVHLVDTLDELCPAPAESSGFGAVIPVGSSRGNMLAVARRNTDGGFVVPPALAPRDVRVRPVIPDEVTPGLWDVHDHAGQKLGRVEGLGRIARLPGTAVVPSLRLIEHLTIPTPRRSTAG